jgi:hypothetical protein
MDTNREHEWTRIAENNQINRRSTRIYADKGSFSVRLIDLECFQVSSRIVRSIYLLLLKLNHMLHTARRLYKDL